MLLLTNEILPISVLTASFLGSTHCAGMCGPFTIMFRGRIRSLFTYHIARALMYVTLGALSGAFGAQLLQSIPILSLPWIGLVFFIIYFIFLAIQMVTGQFWHVPLPKSWSKYALMRAMKTQGEVGKGLGIGLASVLLPCGWLYSFVLAAIGTHSIVHGALLMFAFWLGTIPALSVAPILIKRVLGSRQLSPRVAAMILLTIGIFASAAKFGVFKPTMHSHAAVAKETYQSCH